MRARGLCRVFAGGEGVQGIDLEVWPGRVHALVGLNGAGKTTLMRLLLGMLHAAAGQVRIGGHELPMVDVSAWKGVGHLIGQPLAYPELNVAANLAIAARLHGVEARAIPDAVAQALTDLDLHQYAHTRARVLSAGNLQRLGLAGALAHDPEVIVLDEPTTALDPAGVLLLRALLLRRAADGAGVLVSSHHLDEVARIADEITVVNRGRVVGSLDPGGADLERAFFAVVRADEEERAT